jgi:hypothetical protein
MPGFFLLSAYDGDCEGFWKAEPRGMLGRGAALGSASLGIPRAVIFSNISERYDINRMPFPGPGIVLRFRSLACVLLLPAQARH